MLSAVEMRATPPKPPELQQRIRILPEQWIGLLMLVFVLVILGFVLAWVTGIVAHEEISIGKAIAILVVNAIVGFVAGLALDGTGMDPLILQIINIPLSLVILAGMLTLMGDIPSKKSIIIAAVFSLVLFVVALIMGLIVAGVAGPAA